MKTKKAFVALCSVSLLGACTSVTEPVPMGKDTYMVALDSHGGFFSNGELLSETIKRAGDFCSSKGQQIEVVSTNAHGVQGWTPQENQVVFRCLDANDKAYVRPDYKPAPNVVIENR